MRVPCHDVASTLKTFEADVRLLARVALILNDVSGQVKKVHMKTRWPPPGFLKSTLMVSGICFNCLRPGTVKGVTETSTSGWSHAPAWGPLIIFAITAAWPSLEAGGCCVKKRAKTGQRPLSL